MKENINDVYRRLFSSAEGQKVLIHQLTELGYFDELVENTENLTLQNYARKLLKHCMILKEENIRLFIDELFKKSVPNK